MKKGRLFTLALLSSLFLGVSTPVVSSFVGQEPTVVYAIDNFGGNNNNSESEGNTSEDTGSIADEMKGYKPVDEEDMQKAKESSSWLTDLTGVFISFIIIVTFALVFVITALDFLYIAVPFVRGFLYTAGTDGTGGLSGNNMSGSTSFMGKQWVSDEAVMVSAMLGGSAQANGHMSGGMPGMMGGGMMGGPAMGLGAQNASTQQKGGKSPIRVYIAKRVGFLIFLGVASVLLFTSAFTDFGINVGGMLLDVLGVIAEKLNSISFGG